MPVTAKKSACEAALIKSSKLSFGRLSILQTGNFQIRPNLPNTFRRKDCLLTSVGA